MGEALWKIGETNAPLPPLARGLPLLGNAIEMGGDTIAFFAKTYQELGPVFRVRALTREFVVLGGAAANEFMAQAGDQVLSGAKFFGGLNEELGSSIVFPALDGDIHNYYRKLFRPSYSREMITPRFWELVELTRKRIKTWSAGEKIRVVPMMQEIITDQLGIALTGMVSGENFEDLRNTLKWLIMAKLMKSAPGWTLKLPGYKRSKAQSVAFMKHILATHKALEPGQRVGDLIDNALAAVGHDGKPLTEGDLNAIGFGAFFVGMDTAAHTTSFTLYLLLKHPEILKRVIAETEVLFSRESFTFQDLRHLKALHGAVVESMRMYPVAPIMPRHASQTFEFAGHRIEKGASVMMATALTHYLQEHFPNPDVFDIDRKTPAPFTYAPFGLGAHTCMGAGLADVLITLTLATICNQVDLSITPNDFAMKVIGVPVPNPGQNFFVKVNSLREAAVPAPATV